MNKKGISGFTLVEIMVSVALLGLLSLAVSNGFFYILRGSARSDARSGLKQNGEYALSVLEVKIRNAKAITSTCDSVARTSLSITNPDLTQSTFSCSNQTSNRITEVTTTTTEYLTNTSVSIPSCTTQYIAFTCTQDPLTLKKTISLSFSLQPRSSGAIDPLDQLILDFSSQIQIRNN